MVKCNLREMISRAGFSGLRQFAEVGGMAYSTVRMWCRGKSAPIASNVSSIMKTLHSRDQSITQSDVWPEIFV